MTVLVIGCGAMGSFMARMLVERELDPLLFDRDREALMRAQRAVKARALASLDADLSDLEGVIIAVPIDAVPGAIKEVATRLSRDAWLIEIASFKRPIQPALKYARRRGLTCVSAHPLFGPMTKSLADTTTAHVSPAERDEERRILRRILKGTRIIEVSARQHDEAMGICISLTHAIGLAAGLLLSKRDKATITLSTKSLSILNELVAIALSEPPSFYEGYAMNNKDARMAYTTYIEELRKVTSKKNSSRLSLLASRARREIASLTRIDEIYRGIYDDNHIKY